MQKYLFIKRKILGSDNKMHTSMYVSLLGGLVLIMASFTLVLSSAMHFAASKAIPHILAEKKGERYV